MAENINVINLGFVNAYLVRTEDGFILVDTGISQQWPKLEKAMNSAGCQPGNLKLAVITHGDQDHTGNCATLQSRYGAKIAMHESDLSMVESGKQSKRTITQPLMRVIMIIGKFIGRFRKSGEAFNKFKPDILLADGQSFKEFGWNAKVIHTPGHTKGSIVILTEEGILIAGDTLNNMRKPAIAPIVENFEDLNESISKIRSLDIKAVYPGHGKQFKPGDLFK